MFLQRSAIAAARRSVPRAIARRTFTSSFVRRDASQKPTEAGHSGTAPSVVEGYKTLDQIKSEADLFGPGAKVGTVPTDIEQSTGLERLEILGKMQGVDVFDMRPLDASRVGTLEDPIVVNSAGEEQYVGCTGCPADSHNVLWITLTREEPVSRCMECGSAYKMHYVGPAEDPHAHDHGHGHHGKFMYSNNRENPHPKPKNMADFLKPEYANL
ncbi:cytochrome c oxidase-like protein polypeptide IV [Aaosphaeria arxii CBS 175.79]|uniref:Cytochrome c oxidase subunit 4, mitochondrial n=1 Tax=Aaosphaeria arxii CBS 175.79 TaxID=1450172 RepID=A0A6A5XCJ6_9PLEO|nr:cytochrome c oxidase-like protein polypeptide IV [Aaosphaeria arxii CBS 175.79]KAF2010536.1 cytochrome c oxidase-like protein polypeptide IV [Aaosphaeria arxii CBS 175.79]